MVSSVFPGCSGGGWLARVEQKLIANMSHIGQTLRDLVMERLSVAADEIFVLFEQVIAEYEEEALRTRLLLQPRQEQHKEVAPNPPEEEKEEARPPPLDVPFPPVTVKTENDADDSSFIEQEPNEENKEGNIGEQCESEEPGCSMHLQSDNEEHIYTSYDSDDSFEWATSASRSTTTCDGQNDSKFPNVSLFFPNNNPFGDHNDVMIDPSTGEIRRHKCSDCGKSFLSEELLQKHIFIHNAQSPFRCPVCNKLCRNKSGFKKHLNIHTEEKLFSCPMCMKGFNQKCNLKRHMITHTEEKSYSCPECGLKLKQQHNLLRHISAVHRGERPYSCPVCERGFSQKTTYIVHMRTHTGEKPFTCPVCKKRFRDKCHLKRHAKTHRILGGVEHEVIDSN